MELKLEEVLNVVAEGISSGRVKCTPDDIIRKGNIEKTIERFYRSHFGRSIRFAGVIMELEDTYKITIDDPDEALELSRKNPQGIFDYVKSKIDKEKGQTNLKYMP